MERKREEIEMLRLVALVAARILRRGGQRQGTEMFSGKAWLVPESTEVKPLH